MLSRKLRRGGDEESADGGVIRGGEVPGKGEASGCNCGGRLCSKHGISFSTCLSKCVPVKNLSLSRVAQECVFVTMELHEMEPNHLRFLCYYYYATSVYQFHGKGNRVELPDCILDEIRDAYPNKD